MIHLVYRCYDAEDQLLYIGCTSQPIEKRMAHHRSGNPALARRVARWTTEEYPDRESGLRAEAYAIYDEAPLLNVYHNAKRHPTKGQSLALDRPKDFEDMRLALERVLPSLLQRPTTRAG